MRTIIITLGLLCFSGFVFADKPVTGPSGTVCESAGGSCKGIPDGINIPYKNNCSKFIQCFLECGCDKECSGGLHFNSKLQVCDWPTSAGCDPECVNPTPGYPGIVCPTPGVLCKNVTDGTLIPYENDCTKFIQCSNGCEYSKNCPPGTHFCSQLQACTWPSQAGCDPSYVDPTPGTGCESSGKSCQNVTDGSLIPYENDCTKFIQCSNGCEHSKNCPPGTHFCSQLQACTWPSQAGCDPSYVDPTPGTGCEFIVDSCRNVTDGTLVAYENDCSKFIECSKGCGSNKKCPSGMHFSPILQSCTTPTKASCDPSYIDRPPKPSEPECQSPGGSCANIKDGTLIYYKDDCSKYIECSKGCAYDKKCPSGMHFSPKLQSCTTPSKASCDPSYIDRPPKPSEPECQSPGGSCANIKDGTFIYYKDDCSKYIECSKGCGYDKKCPSGMHFCPILQSCTTPSKAGCDPSYIDRPLKPSEPGCQSPGGSCANIKDGTFISYKDDCSKFIECSKGCAYDKKCPSGMHFSPKLQSCTTPSKASCDPSYIDRPPKPSEPECQSPGGSCANIKDGTFIYYKDDCSKYIECSKGCGYDKKCPSGMHFCPILQSCTTPSKAGCDPSYIDRPPKPSEPGCQSPGGSCANIKDGTFISYKDDCNKYIECSKGCGYDKKCPSGMHFCPILQSCTTPSKAGCDPSYIDRPPKPSEPGCQSPGGSCANIKDGTFISYKDDCSKFIECSKGCGYDIKCPSGLHFSPKLQGCTLPPRAGCDPSYVAPPPDTSTTICASEGLCNNIKDGVLISYDNNCNMFLECFKDCGIIRECPSGMYFQSKLQGCTLLPETGCNPVRPPKPIPGTGQNSCSGEEPGKLLSFIGNCSKYIACGEGYEFIMDCGSQFHFNAALEICDWPEKAGCDSSYVQPEPILTCQSKGASCAGVDSGKLLSYAGNCTKFVACVNGCAFDMNCGNGLHFNKDSQACDCPHRAGCDSTITSNSVPCPCQECSVSTACSCV